MLYTQGYTTLSSRTSASSRKLQQHKHVHVTGLKKSPRYTLRTDHISDKYNYPTFALPQSKKAAPLAEPELTFAETTQRKEKAAQNHVLYLPTNETATVPVKYALTLPDAQITGTGKAAVPESVSTLPATARKEESAADRVFIFPDSTTTNEKAAVVKPVLTLPSVPTKDKTVKLTLPTTPLKETILTLAPLEPENDAPKQRPTPPTWDFPVMMETSFLNNVPEEVYYDEVEPIHMPSPPPSPTEFKFLTELPSKKKKKKRNFEISAPVADSFVKVDSFSKTEIIIAPPPASPATLSVKNAFNAIPPPSPTPSHSRFIITPNVSPTPSISYFVTPPASPLPEKKKDAFSCSHTLPRKLDTKGNDKCCVSPASPLPTKQDKFSFTLPRNLDNVQEQDKYIISPPPSSPLPAKDQDEFSFLTLPRKTGGREHHRFRSSTVSYFHEVKHYLKNLKKFKRKPRCKHIL